MGIRYFTDDQDVMDAESQKWMGAERRRIEDRASIIPDPEHVRKVVAGRTEFSKKHNWNRHHTPQEVYAQAEDSIRNWHSDEPEDPTGRHGKKVFFWDRDRRPIELENSPMTSAYKAAAIQVLRGGKEGSCYRGWADCRICGTHLGSCDRYGHGFMWPDKADHYVEAHNVRTPELDDLLRAAGYGNVVDQQAPLSDVPQVGAVTWAARTATQSAMSSSEDSGINAKTAREYLDYVRMYHPSDWSQDLENTLSNPDADLARQIQLDLDDLVMRDAQSRGMRKADVFTEFRSRRREIRQPAGQVARAEKGRTSVRPGQVKVGNVSGRLRKGFLDRPLGTSSPGMLPLGRRLSVGGGEIGNPTLTSPITLPIEVSTSHFVVRRDNPGSGPVFDEAELHPGLAIRVVEGLDVGVVEVGTADEPMFLIAKGQDTSGLIPLIPALATAIAAVIRNSKAAREAGAAVDRKGAPPPSQATSTAYENERASGVMDGVGAVLVDSDGKRTFIETPRQRQGR